MSTTTTTTSTITLNADLGEDATQLFDGTQEALLDVVDLANIACGGHAGDTSTMRASVEQCRARNVAIGAHPSYVDRANFGRVSRPFDGDAILAQLEALAALAPLHHVKPHGALYHDACRDPAVADALIAVVAHFTSKIVLLAGAPLLTRYEAAGLTVMREGFADRGYRADGTLIPRTDPGALLHDPNEAVAQALQLTNVDTLCVHADTPGALALSRAVREALARRR
jgi:UPF0271 protein